MLFQGEFPNKLNDQDFKVVHIHVFFVVLVMNLVFTLLTFRTVWLSSADRKTLSKQEMIALLNLGWLERLLVWMSKELKHIPVSHQQVRVSEADAVYYIEEVKATIYGGYNFGVLMW